MKLEFGSLHLEYYYNCWKSPNLNGSSANGEEETI